MTIFANAVPRNGQLELKDSIEFDLNKMPSSDPIAFAYGVFKGRSYKPNNNIVETFEKVHGSNYKELSQEYLRGYLLGRKGILVKEGTKIKKGIEDDLDEIIDSCKESLLNDFIEYLDDNPDIDDFDTYYQQQGADAVHEIADSNTPIYYSNIDDLYYLYGDEFDEAYRNAGVYNEPPDNYRQVAIYFYLSEQTFDFMRELEEWFDNNYKDFLWKNNKIRRSGLIKKLKEEFS